ncbi:hypothetical protein VTN00DRAFT_9198 [Thermoascus crustaceus]|uniref:uncharacterized protein n=1 Tax=Thermoascus crustaceus TaxID=5088 RepID=UPI003744402A
MASELPNTNASSPPSGHMRQRSRQACVPCRQRKRKCDGKLPCSTCTGYGYNCQYNNDEGQRSTSKRSASDSSTQLPAAKVPRLASESNNHDPKQGTVPPLQHGILEPSKSRYMSRHSSVAFPRCLGLDLQSANPPRLHSFAYHTGIRSEPGFAVSFQLIEFISWDKVRGLVDIYTSTIQPVFGFLDMDRLCQKCEEHWNGKPQGPGFEAIISGVIGLASLFSGFLAEEQETRIVLHAKELLEDSYCSRFPSIEQVAAWILRTIYIRATTRPHMAWLCSCITMHLVEATGLHRETEGVVLATDRKTGPAQETSAIRERVAQVARCLNVVISYDYGRSIVDIGPMFQKQVEPRPGDFTHQLCGLVRAVPLDDMNQDTVTRRADLIQGLDNLIATPTDHDFLTLVRTELCFCIYRRLRLLDQCLRQEQLEKVISVGTSALPAARRLIAQNHPWWNVIGTVFQFVCVLLTIDTTESLANIPEAMETLEMITQNLNTHLANEAINTARLLVCASVEKKRKGIAILEGIGGVPALDNATGLENQWLLDETDWDAFLRPPATQFINMNFQL